MSASQFLNRVYQNVSGTPGTGPFTLGTAVSSVHFTAAEAGGTDGKVVGYVAIEGTAVEMGFGTLGSSATTLTRDAVTKSKIAGTVGTTKFAFTSAASVFLDVQASDLPGPGMLVPEELTGNGTAGPYTLQNVPGSMVGVYIGTDFQPPSKYTLGAQSITFVEAVPTGVPIPVVYLLNTPIQTAGDRVPNYWAAGSTPGTGPYTLSTTPPSFNSITVLVGHVEQRHDTSRYTLSGNVVTLSAAPGALDDVEILVDQPLGIGVPAAATVGAAQLKASGIPIAVGVVNGTFAASRSASAETYSLKTLAGTDPTAADPVYCIFNDGAGGYAVVTVSAALSVTIPSTKHTGAPSTTAFRNWIGILNNAGVAELFVQNCSDATGIVGLPVSGAVTTTAISGANSAKVPYSAVARTAKQAFWIGWAEYPDTMTQGTWNTAPTFVHLQQTNDPTPGQPVGNTTYASTTTSSATTANTMGDGTVTGSITPTSKANIIQATAVFGVFSASTAIAGVARMYRGGVAGTALGPAGLTFGGAAANCNAGVTIINRDRPGSVSAVTYTIARASATSGQQVQAPSGDGGYMHLEELMG